MRVRALVCLALALALTLTPSPVLTRTIEPARCQACTAGGLGTPSGRPAHLVRVRY